MSEACVYFCHLCQSQSDFHQEIEHIKDMKAHGCVTTTENLYISDRFCAHSTNQTPGDVGKSCFPDGSAVLHQGAYFVLGYNCLRLFMRSEGLCMTYVHKPHTNRKILAAPAKRLHREKNEKQRVQLFTYRGTTINKHQAVLFNWSTAAFLQRFSVRHLKHNMSVHASRIYSLLA